MNFLFVLSHVFAFCCLSSEKADIVPGYDFLVNSVWPEIIKGIDERIPSLFNAGNPDTFYEVRTVTTQSRSSGIKVVLWHHNCHIKPLEACLFDSVQQSLEIQWK